MCELERQRKDTDCLIVIHFDAENYCAISINRIICTDSEFLLCQRKVHDIRVIIICGKTRAFSLLFKWICLDSYVCVCMLLVFVVLCARVWSTTSYANQSIDRPFEAILYWVFPVPHLITFRPNAILRYGDMHKIQVVKSYHVTHQK